MEENKKDNSHLRPADEALMENEEMLSFALEASETGAWDLCLKDRTIRRSLLHDKIFGYNTPLPKWNYDSLLAHVIEEDRKIVDIGFHKAVKTQRDWKFECRIRRADGMIRWIKSAGRHRPDKNGELNFISGIIQDITKPKEAEKALRESEERFRALVDASAQIVWTTNARGEVVQDSQSWRAYTGQSQEERKGWGWLNAVHPEDREYASAKWQEAVESRTRLETRFRLRHIGGNWRWTAIRAVPLKNPDGSVRGWVGMNMDINERRLAEEALEHSRDELEQRVRMRTAELEQRARQLVRLTSELTMAEQRERRRLAEVLHDHLQQLLVAARMQVEQLSDPMPPDIKRRTLDILHNTLDEAIASTRSLTRDLSPPVLYRGGLPAALHWLSENMRQKQQIAVDVYADEKLDDMPESMNVFLFTAARELLLNVCKHAETSKAKVRLFRKDNSVFLSIEDYGKGFDPAEIITGEATEGFGLFSIRERAEFLGGQLTVFSASGRGSCFSVRIPIVDSPELSEKATTAHPETKPTERITLEENTVNNSHIRVLLVDDHKVMREGLKSLLDGQEGLEVVGQADNGQQAIESVAQLHPDVVTMDVSMPIMDGIEATRIIKNRWPGVRVIGLSMFDETELAAKMQEAGADRYLTKTGPSMHLLEAIRS